MVFDLLKTSDIEAILDIMLAELSERLKEKGISMSLTSKAKKFFITKGFDPKFGARPMRRLIQKELEDRIALKLINREIQEGASVQVSVAKGSIQIS